MSGFDPSQPRDKEGQWSGGGGGGGGSGGSAGSASGGSTGDKTTDLALAGKAGWAAFDKNMADVNAAIAGMKKPSANVAFQKQGKASAAAEVIGNAVGRMWPFLLP